VRNLQSETDQDQFDTITGLPSPSYFTLGPPSHSYPESRSESVVKYLSEQGMESWTVIPTDGTYRGKAAAKFESRETASRAIAALNNTEVKELGRSKLFLAHQYSVKLSTPTNILTAVKEQIETPEQNLRKNGHVRLKCYPPPNGTSRYSSIRVRNSIMIYNSKPCSTMTFASHRHQCCSSLVFQRSTFLFLFYKINNNSRGSSRTCGNKWFFATSSLLGLRRPVQGVTCCAQAYI
jgi:hypothetical protein